MMTCSGVTAWYYDILQNGYRSARKKKKDQPYYDNITEYEEVTGSFNDLAKSSLSYIELDRKLIWDEEEVGVR